MTHNTLHSFKKMLMRSYKLYSNIVQKNWEWLTNFLLNCILSARKEVLLQPRIF
jgi:hypothetical protein